MRRLGGLAALALLLLGLLPVPKVTAAGTTRPNPTSKKQPPAPLPGWVVDRVRFEPLDASGGPLGVVGVGDYRGAIEVGPTAATGTTLAVINEVGFEDYLLGISEVPTSWPVEAQKAQAIAARTYALHELFNPAASATKDAGADICASDSCQVYAGVAKEQRDGAAAWTAAVRATANQVLVFRGRPILAKYSSSNGGRAVAGSEPYLRAIDDPDDATSPLHHWHVSLPIDEVATALGVAATPPPTALIRDGASVLIAIVDPDGLPAQSTIPVADFRSKVNSAVPAPEGRSVTIPSVRFAAALDPTTGNVEIDGIGYGHGIGMSQWGAFGKAVRGMKADAILAAYYAGLKPVTVPDGKLPQSIRVSLSLDAQKVDVVSRAGTGRFRAFDGSGRPLATLASGDWQVVPGPRPATVRVIAPSDQAGPLALTAALPPEVAPGRPVPIDLAVSVPAVVRVTAVPPGGGPITGPAMPLSAGTSHHELPTAAIAGDYRVVIHADAGGGRSTEVPLTFAVKVKPAIVPLQTATSRAGVTGLDQRGGGRHVTGAMAFATALLVLVLAVLTAQVALAARVGRRRVALLH